MSEHMTSPKAIYENPEQFSGIIGMGLNKEDGTFNPSYPKSVHKLMGSMYPDWNEKLSDNLKKNSTQDGSGRWWILYSPTDSQYAYPIDITEFTIK